MLNLLTRSSLITLTITGIISMSTHAQTKLMALEELKQIKNFKITSLE